MVFCPNVRTGNTGEMEQYFQVLFPLYEKFLCLLDENRPTNYHKVLEQTYQPSTLLKI